MHNETHRSEAMLKNCEFCMPEKTSKNFLTLQLIQLKISSSDIHKNIFSICNLAISCSLADAREVTVASAWHRASQACQRRPQQREVFCCFFVQCRSFFVTNNIRWWHLDIMTQNMWLFFTNSLVCTVRLSIFFLGFDKTFLCSSFTRFFFLALFPSCCTVLSGRFLIQRLPTIFQ